MTRMDREPDSLHAHTRENPKNGYLKKPLAEIETRRLRLLALNTGQLRLLLENSTQLQEILGLDYLQAGVDDPARRAIQIKLNKMQTGDDKTQTWYTYWLLVLKDHLTGAGLAGFKGVPGALGDVEIGYGIDESFQGQGYMTEAVQALLDWAFQHHNCRLIVAQTRKDNLASQRVLERCGFRRQSEDGEEIQWEATRQEHFKSQKDGLAK